MACSNQLRLLVFLVLTTLLTGCATLTGNADSPNVRVIGLDPLPSEGFEARFALKLRVQNPNESDLSYDGLSVKLNIDGRGLASGVSNATGQVPRFGETVLTIPISISAISVFRQAIALVSESTRTDNALQEPLGYTLTGKLGAAAGSFRATRFSGQGKFDFSSPGNEQENEQDNEQNSEQNEEQNGELQDKL